ncbi:sugar transferase [Agreia sp. COWG]|uniref:sugar transferase n=1 Tax=Agreia sp. COWG TaxID=2773266 RepID=UPI001AF76F62|nr:sugar transferase [Agreia sp. COWG]CAD5991288.1 Polyprenyl glycosylphosphotransferase [Agreia sp. COWG]
MTDAARLLYAADEAARPGAGAPVTERDSPRAAGARASTRDWRIVYGRRLIVTDALAVIFAVTVPQLLLTTLEVRDFWQGATRVSTSLAESPVVGSALLVVVWMAVLALYGTRDIRVVGSGAAEYRRIIEASVLLFGLFAITAYLVKSEVGRSFVITAFPLGLLLLLASRYAWRRWLKRERLAGRYSAQVLLVGSFESVSHTARELGRHPEAGYHVVGAVVPTGLAAAYLPGTEIPVVGDLSRLDAALAASGADTVAITSSDELTPQRIRELSWSLEPGHQHLIVAPSLTDIGGPRIHTRPVAGLPLIHVETPRFEGKNRAQKRVFDVLSSGALLLMLAPLLLMIAAGVRLSTPGPVLFRQTRVGLGGETFEMLKFRSMVTNAEEILENLRVRERSEGNSVLFKMKNDPRITPLGSFLRRFSLDELPQLINVFRGDMSLIGPRPPLGSEVEQYEKHVHRRFLMKPGITGLWQVSGRSNLSWEDSVRLDLYYVENWSMVSDIGILWRTLRAVLARDGAY